MVVLRGSSSSVAAAQVLDAAYIQHPERFARERPEAPEAVWINPPARIAAKKVEGTASLGLTLRA